MIQRCIFMIFIFLFFGKLSAFAEKIEWNEGMNLCWINTEDIVFRDVAKVVVYKKKFNGPGIMVKYEVDCSSNRVRWYNNSDWSVGWQSWVSSDTTLAGANEVYDAVCIKALKK